MPVNQPTIVINKERLEFEKLINVATELQALVRWLIKRTEFSDEMDFKTVNVVMDYAFDRAEKLIDDARQILFSIAPVKTPNGVN